MTALKTMADMLAGTEDPAWIFAVNGFERFFDSGGRGISILATAHGLIDGFNHVRRSFKVKVERVANVQRQNFVSLPRDLIGDACQVADRITNIFQAGGRRDLAELSNRHERILTAEA